MSEHIHSMILFSASYKLLIVLALASWYLVFEMTSRSTQWAGHCPVHHAAHGQTVRLLDLYR